VSGHQFDLGKQISFVYVVWGTGESCSPTGVCSGQVIGINKSMFDSCKEQAGRAVVKKTRCQGKVNLLEYVGPLTEVEKTSGDPWTRKGPYYLQ